MGCDVRDLGAWPWDRAHELVCMGSRRPPNYRGKRWAMLGALVLGHIVGAVPHWHVRVGQLRMSA